MTRIVPFLLAISPLPFSVAFGFTFAGLRARHRPWTWAAVGYSFATLACVWLFIIHPAFSLLGLGVWIGGTVHAFSIRDELGERVARLAEEKRLKPAFPVVEAPHLKPAYRVIEAPEGEAERRRQERIAALRARADAAAAPGESRAPRALRRRCTYCGGLMDEQDRDCRGCGAPA